MAAWSAGSRRFPTMPFPVVDLLKAWRATGAIGETVFQKVARDNTVRRLRLD